MATIILRQITGSGTTKGTPLTIAEVDTNFDNLNLAKYESTDAASTNTASKLVIRDASGNFSAGTITATNFDSTSDRNAKDNIAPITSAIDTLNQIDGVSFTWKADGVQSYGVIAQELQKVLPELVSESDEGLAVKYTPLIAFLIEAVKSQEKRIAQLESIINEARSDFK